MSKTRIPGDRKNPEEVFEHRNSGKIQLRKMQTLGLGRAFAPDYGIDFGTKSQSFSCVFEKTPLLQFKGSDRLRL